MIVLDCSAAMALALADEVVGGLVRLQEELRDQPLIVPPLWPYEAANALVKAERRGRVRSDEARAVAAALEQLPVILDDAGCAEALHAVLEVAKVTGLSAYDASYLELADRLGIPLATLDGRLAAAAEDRGIKVL